MKLDGEVYELRYPTVEQVKTFSGMDKKGVDENVELMVDFLEGLGLPKKVSYGMEADHLKELLEELNGSEKK